MAIESTDADEQVLALRTQSKSFAKIAGSLGLGRADDANEAFNRALRRRPLEEQATIRAAENVRLDRLQRAVAADENRTKDDIDRRLRAVERLRTRLMSD